MASLRIRLLIGFLILVISLAILVWGFWPTRTTSRTIPISPDEMQLPTPQSLIVASIWSA